MAKIEFSDAKMYIVGSDDSYAPFGVIEDAVCISNDSEGIAPHTPFINLADSFEHVCKVSKDGLMAILGIRDAVLKCCPNKRVVYLASHAKKACIRKKNFRRAIKILERMED